MKCKIHNEEMKEAGITGVFCQSCWQASQSGQDSREQKLFKALSRLWYMCYGGHNVDDLHYRAAYHNAQDVIKGYVGNLGLEMDEAFYEQIKKAVETPTPEYRWPTEMIELVKIVLPHVSCYYEGEYNPDVRVASEELQFLIDNLTQSKAQAPTEEAIDYFDKMETLIGYLKLALDKQYKVPTELGEVIFEAEQFVKEKKAAIQWLQTSAGTREAELGKCLGELLQLPLQEIAYYYSTSISQQTAWKEAITRAKSLLSKTI